MSINSLCNAAANKLFNRRSTGCSTRLSPLRCGAHHPDQLRPVDEVTCWSLDSCAKADIHRFLHEAITDPLGQEFMASPARSAAA
jgi:hypothetical protein